MPAGTRSQRLVVIGGGTVGAAVVRLLQDLAGVELRAVVVRDAARERQFPRWRELVTSDSGAALEADLLVEVAGGVGGPADVALAALERGTPVVTANKAALAERWHDFLPHLRAGRVWLEAAVMGGAPVVGPLTGALRGCRPTALHAVLNGTCNAILSDMEAGSDYASALRRAQEAGFAEADPTLDVEGIDAAHKLTLLARLAFDPDLRFDEVTARGVAGLAAEAVSATVARGRHVRLVGSVGPASGGWRAEVRPLSLPQGHPLVVSGPTNAMLFTGEPLGEVHVRGPGAGGGATASAVVADVVAALAGGRGHVPLGRPAAPPTLVSGTGALLPEGAEVL